MITRSTLVEQLRDYQIRSQYKWPALTLFSPKPHFTSRADVAVAIFWALLFIMLVVSSYVTFYQRADVVVAIFWALLFIMLVVSSYVTFYQRHVGLSCVIICCGIFLPIRLRISRRALVKKRERRLLLSLSM